MGLITLYQQNTLAKDKLALVGDKRVPAHFYGNSSRVSGYEDENGLKAFVYLNFRKQNAENFLQCYEIEILKLGWLHPETTNISPEATWQPEQFHYCLSHQETFPLLPLELSKISKISFVAKFMEDPQTLAEILEGLPLTVDGKNQWFAKMPYRDGILSLISTGIAKSVFLSYQRESSTDISAEQIYEGLKDIDHFGRGILSSLK